MPDAGPPDEAASAERLTAEHQRITARIAALSRDFDDLVESAEGANLDDEHDPEGATIGFERAQIAGLLSQARAHLVEVERAQAQARCGRYGVCEACGGPIAPERLTVLPTARHCLSCATGTARRRP